jgi:hypothetical protein
VSLGKIDTRHYHDLYERLPHEVRIYVTSAYEAAAGVLRYGRLSTSNDDVAEELVAVIIYYVLESNPGIKDKLLPAVTGDNPTAPDELDPEENRRVHAIGQAYDDDLWP